MGLIHFEPGRYHQLLFNWYDQYGRHDLPWQGDFNPYHVWLSEIMLQQTQVKTVIPYFKKFVACFPDIESLAKADSDTVMCYWAGLGYYARARNLHKTAKIISAHYHGMIPKDFSSLITLPGIGRSTANAILSIAFGQKKAILDGNVKRVFARVFALDSHPSDLKCERKLWQIAEKLMPEHRTQAYTQAQMDLGATCCTRVRPSCSCCPLCSLCLAQAKDKVSDYPVKKAKKSKPVKTRCYYLYQYRDQIYLVRNPDRGIWGGLYVLPDHDFVFGEYQGMLVQNKKHSFTHYDLYYDIRHHLLPSDMPLSAGLQQSEKAQTGQWVSLRKLGNYALATPFKNALAAL